MPVISGTRASLRIFGDDLDPDAVSLLLGAAPSVGTRKGETWINKRGIEQTARTGRWLLQAVRLEPGDLDSQLVELLSRLTSDTKVWRSLVTRFKADIFCGLFMKEVNEGFELRPETLEMIGLRGLPLGFDIYCFPQKETGEPKGETN
ncbi:MAG: DUF4279 domain-containing protein [Stellaceae bacterium]